MKYVADPLLPSSRWQIFKLLLEPPAPRRRIAAWDFLKSLMGFGERHGA